jgi:hypothetical protein
LYIESPEESDCHRFAVDFHEYRVSSWSILISKLWRRVSSWVTEDAGFRNEPCREPVWIFKVTFAIEQTIPQNKMLLAKQRRFPFRENHRRIYCSQRTLLW